MSDRQEAIDEATAELKKLEQRRIERLNRQDMNRCGRVGELREFFGGLESHAGIDRDWLRDWKLRIVSIIEGDAR